MRTHARLLILALGVVGSCPAQSPTATVYVTGKLDGYVSSRNAKDFNPWFDHYRWSSRDHKSTYFGDSAVLVGVGDNLALDYWSRFDEGGAPIPRVQNLYTTGKPAPDDDCGPATGQTGPPTAYLFPCTPAAHYLTQIAYTGLVPGIRDFYFGAPLLYHLGNTLDRDKAGGSILPMLGANLVLCDQKVNPAPQSPPPQAQILLPTQASLPSSILLGSASGSSGKGKSGGTSAGGQSGGPPSGGGGGGGPQSPSASTPTAFGCNAGGPSGDQVGSTGAAAIVYPSANSIYPWTTRLVLAIPEQFEPITYVTLQTGAGPADCNNSFSVAVVPLYGGPVAATSTKCPIPTTDACPRPSPRVMPPDTRGLRLYLVDLCGLVDGKVVLGDGTVRSADDVGTSTRPVLAPGSKLQLKVDLNPKTAKHTNNDTETKNARKTTLSQIIPLAVQRPFFDHAWRCWPVECNAGPGKPEYVVFGVADPTMQSEISKVNLEADLYDKENKAASPHHSFTVDFNDASSALSQATQAFEAKNPAAMRSKTLTYVVLAQMTPDVATAFSKALTYRQYTYGRPEHLWDLIVSAADIYSHTPRGKQCFESASPDRIPVITPRPLLLPDHDHLGPSGDYRLLHLTNPIETLTLEKSAGAWSSTVNYAISDVVTNNGSTYRAITNNINFEPDINPNTWAVLAAAGLVGSTTITVALGPGDNEPPVKCKLDDATDLHIDLRVRDRIMNILKIPESKESSDLLHKQPPDPLHMCEAATDFECLALASMAKKLDTDIALLQRRDLYTGCVLADEAPIDDHQNGGQDPQTLKDNQIIERRLPETGFLTRVSVSGATLKSLMQQNDSIVSQSPFSTSPTAVDQDRVLVTFGITKGRPMSNNPITYPKSAKPPIGDVDPATTYYINGLPLDATKIYSIATTDRLATAEPNFSQLSQNDLESPETFPIADRFTYRVAELVRDQLHPAKLERESRNVITSASVTQPTRPVIGWITGNPPPSQSEWGKLGNGLAKAFEWPVHDAASRNPISRSLLPQGEYARQQRGYFGATLQQLSASYSFSHPNLADTVVGASFGGVTNPNVNSAHSDSAAAASNFRFIWNADRFLGLGVDEVVAYSRNRAGSTTQSPPGLLNTGEPLPFSTSTLSANSLIVSPFLQLQHFRSQPDWVPLTVRGLFNSDLARNEQFVKSTVKAGTAAEPVYFILDPLRQQSYGVALGSRFELSSLSYLEGGYLSQHTANVLSGISITGPSNSTVLPLTLLGANESVASILASTSTCSPTQPAPCLMNPGIGDQLNLQSREIGKTAYMRSGC